MDTDYAADLEILKNDGTPKMIHIEGYWKYEFTITGTTDHYSFRLVCGGDRDEIYRFEPYGGWDEWEYAGITYLTYEKL
jgi:hypothetical protein